MIKIFEQFVDVVEWTVDSPNKLIFSNLDKIESKWLKTYCEFGYIAKMMRTKDKFFIWLKDGRVWESSLKHTVVKDDKRGTSKNVVSFEDRYTWQAQSGLDGMLNASKKNAIEKSADYVEYLVNSTQYLRLIGELNLTDITTEKQQKNGTFSFKSVRKWKDPMGKKWENVTYQVYARGVVQVKEGYTGKDIKNQIKIMSWKDYLPLFDRVYEYEKNALVRWEQFKHRVTENMDEEDFEKGMEDSDDHIPNDILKYFSEEDQLTYALETHPDHDFWIFVGRPGFKPVVVNGKKLHEETLEIETLCKVETVSDAKQAGMMKIRATSQGQNSRVYGVWLPKGVFDDEEKYVYGSEIPEFMIPLIDEHKKPI